MASIPMHMSMPMAIPVAVDVAAVVASTNDDSHTNTSHMSMHATNIINISNSNNDTDTVDASDTDDINDDKDNDNDGIHTTIISYGNDDAAAAPINNNRPTVAVATTSVTAAPVRVSNAIVRRGTCKWFDPKKGKYQHANNPPANSFLLAFPANLSCHKEYY
jgi:hypothetical protein